MTAGPDPLTAAITTAAIALPEIQTRAMADVFDEHDAPTTKARRKVFDIVPTGVVGDHFVFGWQILTFRTEF